MNDTLRYFSLDPVHRRYEHRLITFSFMYAWSERFMLPLSHDEVVHGKGSLLGKMPGDPWQKRANLRLLLAYMTAHPGKKLVFMGGELGQWHEWRFGEALDWPLLEDAGHAGLRACLRDLWRMYRETPALHATDADPGAFRWLDLHNEAESVWAFRRGAPGAGLVCVFNATPVPRDGYRVGVEVEGEYHCVFDSDAPFYGGSGYSRQGAAQSEPVGREGMPCSIAITLPPLSAVIYRRSGG
jgi:1,4-alpha-glucan branching enzyme